MTLGQTIKTAREHLKMKQETLATEVGMSPGALSGYENDLRVPEPETVEAIAVALNSNAVRMAYLRMNPVYRAIIPRVFTDLNNIRTDPVAIFTRLAKEADEARLAALELADLFTNLTPQMRPDFRERFDFHMEQILDVKRAVEIAEVELLDSGVMSSDEHRVLYERQQAKCEAKGHHIPERRTGEDRRNGINGSGVGCPSGCDQRHGERRTGTEG